MTLWMPNGNAFPGRAGQRPRWIVLHGTAGGTDARGIASYFKATEGTDRAVSSHYVIGRDGLVVQCVSEQDGAWANGALTPGHADFWPAGVNPNNVTISIEHCKPSADNSDQLTPEQQAASFALVRDICQRWQIPMREADASGGITGHFSLDPVNRSHCPGPYPWEALWDFLKGEEEMIILDLSMPQVAQYFDQAPGGAWRCKQTGYIIGGAILEFYKRFGNAGLNGLSWMGLPLSNEIGVQGYGTCVIQRFERVVAGYNPEHTLDHPLAVGDVFLLHLYQGIGQDPRLLAAQQTIKQLQEQLAASGNAQKITDLESRLKQIGQLAQV